VRARKSDQVLLAARDVFLERGFDAATVDDIAVRARVSKATVYSNFHDKESLLTAMIDRVTTESAQILARAGEVPDDEGTLEARLTRMALALSSGVLDPEIVRMRRLAVSAAVAFPKSAVQYWQRGPAAAVALIEKRLTTMNLRGELHLDDVAITAAQFAYALIGPLQDRALFDVDYAPTPAEMDRHVTAVVRGLMLAHAR
jgi:TetR/AcrR family transcriptional repressor of mexJK operon